MVPNTTALLAADAPVVIEISRNFISLGSQRGHETGFPGLMSGGFDVLFRPCHRRDRSNPPSLLPAVPSSWPAVKKNLSRAALVAGGNRSAAYLMEWLGLPTLESSNDPAKGEPENVSINTGNQNENDAESKTPVNPGNQNDNSACLLYTSPSPRD